MKACFYFVFERERLLQSSEKTNEKQKDRPLFFSFTELGVPVCCITLRLFINLSAFVDVFIRRL